MADQVPGLLTRTIPATVRPRSRCSNTRRGWLDGGRDPVTGPESTSLRYSRGAQPRPMFRAGEIDDRRPELVAVDRLAQVALEARGAHAGIPQALGDERDRRHPAPLADVHVPQALEELAVGPLGRGEVAHDDVGDEGHPDGVSGAGRRDDGAPQLEHRPEVVTRVKVVVDDQNVNTLELGETDVTHRNNRVANALAACRGRGRHLRGPARQPPGPEGALVRAAPEGPRGPAEPSPESPLEGARILADEPGRHLRHGEPAVAPQRWRPLATAIPEHGR